MKLILKKKSGFTFVEVIAILLILGVVGSIVISRNQNSGADSIGQRESIKGHIRYAQLLAMKSNTICGVQFNGSSYAVFKNGSTSDKITLPNKDAADITIASSLGTANETICFDLWGTPYSDIGLTAARPSGPVGSLGFTMITDTGYVQ